MKNNRSREEIEFEVSNIEGDRIMPTGDILKLKKADYQVYAWLQSNCLWGSKFANEKKKQNDDWSYIYKDSCSSRHIASFLKGCSFNTVARALKNLEELGLIISSYDNKGDEVYILPKPENIQANNGNYYILIPAPLLRKMSNALNKDAIKLYCVIRAYTENEYRKTGEYGWYYKNLQDMALDIGLGKGAMIEMKISDIIDVLEDLELITVERRPLYDKDGKIICANKHFVQAKFQTHYKLLRDRINGGNPFVNQRKEKKGNK